MPERWLFKIILEKFGYLPSPTIAIGNTSNGRICGGHKGILDFYYFYNNAAR